MFRPAAQQCLQHARGSALPDRHATRNANDVRNTLAISAKKLFQYSLAAQIRADIEIE